MILASPLDQLVQGSDGSEKSISIAKASRLKSSSILSSRIAQPSSSMSCMKSIDHTSAVSGLWTYTTGRDAIEFDARQVMNPWARKAD